MNGLGRKITLTIVFLLLFSGLAGAVGPVRITRDARLIRVDEALDWLVTQQEDDGSFGHSPSLTADVVFVLALTGENPDEDPWVRNGHSALEALAAYTPQIVASGKAGAIAKVLRAVSLTEADQRHFAGYDLVAELMKKYNSVTGRFDPSSNFSQALAIQALVTAGETPPAKAILALIQEQHNDGGWGWQAGGTTSDVDTTGLILETFGAIGVPPTVYRFQEAIAYLQARQQPDGGWGMNAQHPESNCNSTALAMRGLVWIGANVRTLPWTGPNPDGSWRDPLGRLMQFQAPDGGFRWQDDIDGTRVLATTDAIPALFLPWNGDAPLSVQYFIPAVVQEK